MKLDQTSLGLLLAGLTALCAACTVTSDDGDDDDDGAGATSAGGTAGTGGAGNSGTVEFECCINGAGYECPNEAALNQCIGFDLFGCLDQCSWDDFDCQDACFAQLDQSSPDPSACVSNPAVTCEGPGPGPGPGTCVGEWDGTYCEVDSNCSSYNCVDDKCYGNAPGNPCEVDSDCSTYNCYEGCCYGNDAGNPCEVDSDCSSYNCYDNVCQ